MVENEYPKWLKKFTKLSYLEDTLKNKHLHLSGEEEWKQWDDKNDEELLKAYSAWKKKQVLVCCLTQAKDRFHFWDYFGGRECGVCLWFDNSSLRKDFKKDSSLIIGEAKYKTPFKLNDLKECDIPFTKREQYRDECEYRILRSASYGTECSKKLNFPPNSLKRIYLNPWLSKTDSDSWKILIKRWLNGEYSNVKVEQNQSLRYEKWIKKARSLMTSPTS